MWRINEGSAGNRIEKDENKEGRASSVRHKGSSREKSERHEEIR